MTRTLVTGAAGFTGRYVADALARRGHEVHGLVHCHEPGLAPASSTRTGRISPIWNRSRRS